MNAPVSLTPFAPYGATGGGSSTISFVIVSNIFHQEYLVVQQCLVRLLPKIELHLLVQCLAQRVCGPTENLAAHLLGVDRLPDGGVVQLRDIDVAGLGVDVEFVLDDKDASPEFRAQLVTVYTERALEEVLETE